MYRSVIASNVVAGLSGWLQLQIVQNLGDMSGEDSARLVTAQIINAQGQYRPAKSQLPRNWGSSNKYRIDIALKTRSSRAKSWYGAIEIKWPGTRFAPDQMRGQAIEDAMRLTFIRTTYLNARFLLIGGSSKSLGQLFDKPHPRAKKPENRRLAFSKLFKRELRNPKGRLGHADWSVSFPGAGSRIPENIFSNFDGTLEAELLAVANAKVGPDTVGSVYIWQCSRIRGTAV